MENSLRFIFLADTSGSMYGKKIASVNAAMQECCGILKETGQQDMEVLFASFDETFQWIQEKKKMLNTAFVPFEVKAKEDGFYHLTSIKAFYEALILFLKKAENSVDKQVIIVFTDGKVVDAEQCENEFEQLNNLEAFRRAERYVAMVDQDRNALQNDILKFVNYQADHIVNLSELSNKISCMDIFNAKENVRTEEDVFLDSIFQ